MTRGEGYFAKCKAKVHFAVWSTDQGHTEVNGGKGDFEVDAKVPHIGDPLASAEALKEEIDVCHSCFGQTSVCFLKNYQSHE